MGTAIFQSMPVTCVNGNDSNSISRDAGTNTIWGNLSNTTHFFWPPEGMDQALAFQPSVSFVVGSDSDRRSSYAYTVHAAVGFEKKMEVY